MTKRAGKLSSLGVSIRDLLFAFVLAKLMAVVLALVLGNWLSYSQRATESIASIASLCLFLLLVTLSGGKSLIEVMDATKPTARPGGNFLKWILIAIVGGLVIRLGVAGLFLGIFNLSNPEQIEIELADLSLVLVDPTNPLDMLTIPLMFLDAANEEILYRRILQTEFCRRFGLIPGVMIIALIFGSIHASSAAVLMGIWIGIFYLFCRRVWVASLAHCVTNLSIFLMAEVQKIGLQELIVNSSYVCAILLLVITALATRWAMRQDRHTRPAT